MERKTLTTVGTIVGAAALAIVDPLFTHPPSPLPARAASAVSAEVRDQCSARLAQCQCQGREMLRRTPRATLEAIMAQPASDERKAAIANALLATYLRDHIEITKVCGPVLHPEHAPAS